MALVAQRPYADGADPDLALQRSLLGEAKPSVSVVIPTLNEEQNLPLVLERLPAAIDELVIVDGNSTDATVDVALDCRPDAEIVRQTGRQGKGNALALGFERSRGDIIVMLDADGSTDPVEIPRFIATLMTGADFVKGSRFISGGGSADLTPMRRLGNRLLSGTVNTLFGTHYTDLCYGYTAFWRRCLISMPVDSSGFEVETLMNVRAARAGVMVAEIPSFESARLSGVSNLSPVRDGMRVLRTIIAERVRPR